MRHAFITGIPTAGKSHLAKKISESLGMSFIKIDDWRDELQRDPILKEWVDFFRNKNEEEYWQITSPDQEWEDLRNQSEALWPAILKKIKETQYLDRPTIFEGVNILPHLAHRDLDFPGIVMLGDSFEVVLERNKQEPRWGSTDELIRKEAGRVSFPEDHCFPRTKRLFRETVSLSPAGQTSSFESSSRGASAGYFKHYADPSQRGGK